MIQIDEGQILYEIMLAAARQRNKRCMYVAVPFIDTGSRLWRLLNQGVDSGMHLRLLTRPPCREGIDTMVRRLSRRANQVEIIFMPDLHAKAVVLIEPNNRSVMGWVGSHNFTSSSESWAHEMGVAFVGRDDAVIRMSQQVLSTLDGWAQAARSGQPRSPIKHLRYRVFS